MTEPLKHRAVKGAKWMGVSNLVMFTVQVLQMGILARMLAPRDFGLMALLFVVLNIVQGFADFGFGNFIISRKNLTREHFSLIFWSGLCSGFVLYGLLILGAGAVSFFYGEPELETLLKWVALNFLVLPFAHPFQLVLQKKLLFKRIAICEITGSLSGLIISIVLAWTGFGIYSLVFGHMGVVAIRSGLILLFRDSEYFPSFRLKVKELNSLISYGGFQMAEKIVNIINSQIDKLILGKFFGSTALGFYSIAHQFVLRPVMLFNLVLNRVGFPLLSDIQTDSERVKQTYLEMIKFISFCVMPFYFGLFCIADPLLTLWLGHGWGETIKIFKVLVFLGVFVGLGNPIGSLILSKSRPGISFGINVYVLCVNLLAIMAGSHWGIMGISWALLLTMIFGLFPVNYTILKKLADISASEFTLAWLPSLLMAGLMMAAIMLMQMIVAPGSIVNTLALSVLTGFFSYLLLVYYFRKNYLMYVFNLFRS